LGRAKNRKIPDPNFKKRQVSVGVTGIAASSWFFRPHDVTNNVISLGYDWWISREIISDGFIDPTEFAHELDCSRLFT